MQIALASTTPHSSRPPVRFLRPVWRLGLPSVLLLVVLGCTVLLGIQNFVAQGASSRFSASVAAAQIHSVQALNGLMDADQGLTRYAAGHLMGRAHYEDGARRFESHVAAMNEVLTKYHLDAASREAAALSSAYRGWKAAYAVPVFEHRVPPSGPLLERASVSIDDAQNHMELLQAAFANARQAHTKDLRERLVRSYAGVSLAMLLLTTIGLAVDVLRRREQATSLAMLHERARALERSNAALQDFAYVASHDLQEPLRMVSSYTQLLGRRYKGKLDADADDFIGYAVDGAKRMQALIQDILAYSRVGASETPLVEVDTEAALDRALDNLRGAIAESGADIRSVRLPHVRGDHGQLVQLLQNLVGNAIKYRGKEPLQIVISAESHGDVHRFSVRDNGIGIAPECRERVFRMFQRLHGKSEYSGTGIGLAICKRIVERHGGDIGVDAAPGGGSIFHFTLSAA